ncbi:SAF domain-containing protein [Propionibacterium sp.]|uniref:SAF domain-containing protein n=1 Tax=Propionibacterium sp. TaxID=1977903 RepID=UPI0039E76AF7
MKIAAWLHSVKRVVRWHRRGLGALAAAICLVCVLMALTPGAPPSSTVLMTTREIPAGTTLAADDFKTVEVPLNVIPGGALAHTGQVLDHVLAAPRPQGSILTQSDLVGQGLLAGESGMVLAPFRIADPGVAALLRVGDVISVIGSTPDGETKTIASKVRVAALRQLPEASVLGGSGTSDGALVIAAASQTTAKELVAASSHYVFSIIMETS